MGGRRADGDEVDGNSSTETWTSRLAFPVGEFLRRFIRRGELEVIDAHGRRHCYGNAAPKLCVRLHDEKLHRLNFWNPSVTTGEAFMDGTLTMDRGTLYDLLALYTENAERFREDTEWLRHHVPRFLRRIGRHNSLGRSRKNVSHHYDVGNEMYSMFLDKDLQYSCALFSHDEESLETAQQNKKNLICNKLLLEPGAKVLDIGSGWGGLGLEIARQGAANVLGVTLSKEQHAVSQTRARDAGLSKQARFELRDYRHVTGQFDRVVSVGMFEHVGLTHFEEFFGKVRDLLTDDGVAVIHSIGRRSPPGSQNPWLDKYIFPGSYAPALSETIAAVEEAGLWVADVEVLRVHYADTLLAWRKRFMARRDEIVKIYDERFCKMWEFYLTAVEVSLRVGKYMVFQLQLSKKIDAVPRTRDYLFSMADQAVDRAAQ